MNKSTQNPSKDVHASEYYKSLHSDIPKQTVVTIKPAKTKYLKVAGLCFVVGIVFSVVAVKTDTAGLLFEIISAVTFFAGFICLVLWALKTIDKSISNV